MKNNLLRIHFIGICGKLNAGLAIALKNYGYKVTGSDKGFFPPMSDVLKKANFPIMIGFHSSHIDESNPDIVATNSVISPENPELIRSKELGIKIVSPTDLVHDYIIKNKSIVIVGNYGKTTITAILVYIFKSLELNPSYMIGGEVKGLNSAEINDSEWSIVEGDEYPATKGGKSKFFYYNPTILLVTSINWDHNDIFESQEIYTNNFVELFKTIPTQGKIVFNREDQKLSEFFKSNDFIATPSIINYENQYRGRKLFPKIWGDYNIQNIYLALSVLEQIFPSVYLGKNLDLIIDAIEKFPGVSRRNEIIFNEKSFVVIDDFAHNPDKFKAAIESVQKKFSEYRIIVVIEPNMGNRTIPSIEQYKDTFSSKAISQIIIPRWKNSSIQENSNILTEKDFATKIDSFIGNPKCKVILDDSDFLIYLTSLYTENKVPTVILFMSSEPFRGLIEKYKEKLSNPPVV